MIKALRKRFITICGLSILAVFTGIFILLWVFSRAQMNRTLDMLTDTISSNEGVFPEFDPDNREPFPFPGLDEITEETQFSTRFFTVWLNKSHQIKRVNMNWVAAVLEEDVEDYVKEALADGVDRGWVGNYRYKLVNTLGGSTLVFVNGTTYQNTTSRILLTAFFVLLGSGILILLLVIVISKRAVAPIAQSYEKQKQFVTDANHELKTPLTLILSNLDILESEVGKNEWLEDIRSEGQRMGLLINQMVTLSRMDETETLISHAPFDISGVVEQTVSAFQPLAEEQNKHLSAEITSDLTLEGDESMIRRLAAILLDNSVKYCDQGGEIRVKLFRRRHLILTVENTYAAVNQLELDRLFDRFYRADKARTASGSFGVGLSIAQSIVKVHKGNIFAYKKEGEIGFRVELKEK